MRRFFKNKNVTRAVFLILLVITLFFLSDILSVKSAHELEQKRKFEDASTRYAEKKIGSLESLGEHGRNFVEGLDDDRELSQGGNDAWRANLRNKFFALNKN